MVDQEWTIQRHCQLWTHNKHDEDKQNKMTAHIAKRWAVHTSPNTGVNPVTREEGT